MKVLGPNVIAVISFWCSSVGHSKVSSSCRGCLGCDNGMIPYNVSLWPIGCRS